MLTTSLSVVVCTILQRVSVSLFRYSWFFLLFKCYFLAASALPYRRNPPSWLKATPEDVKDLIIKLARKGLSPSQIGVILRDQHGVPQTRFVTGNKILRILKSAGLAPELPEDLYCLIKKAVSVRKHLERNRNDKDSKFRLICIESRIHRLVSLNYLDYNHI